MDTREIMEKEVVTKEDGRTLIYYRFRPESEGQDVKTAKEGEQPS